MAILVGLFLAIAFVQLGLWQLSRHDDRRAYNASVAERIDREPQPLAGLVGQYGTDPEDLVDRNAVVTGRPTALPISGKSR